MKGPRPKPGAKPPAGEGSTGAKRTPSKLDRLLKLAKEGSNKDVRLAAAARASALVDLRPAQVLHLLNAFKALLYSKKLDTRLAASHGIRALARRCEDVARSEGGTSTIDSFNTNKHMQSLITEGCLTFDDLSLVEVMAKGTPLLADSGARYSMEEYEIKLTDDAKLKEARARLDKNMGLEGKNTFFDSSSIVTNDDLVVEVAEVKQEDEARVAIADLLPKMRRQDSSKGATTSSAGASAPAGHAGGGGRKRKANGSAALDSSGEQESELSILQCFDVCSRDFGAHIFDDKWEVRHGSALGLCALFQTLGRSLFAEYNPSRENALLHNPWHVDFAVRLVCLLCLDRFSDFFSESTRAPVKECAATAVGALSTFLPAAEMSRLMGYLAQLVRVDHWHVQQGGLLGVKHAVMADPALLGDGLAGDLLGILGELLVGGSEDEAGEGGAVEDLDDDVFSCAVEVVIVVLERAGSGHLDATQVQRIHSRIWSVLPSLGELHASIPNCMRLLHHVSGVRDWDAPAHPLQQKLSTLLPFMCHPTQRTRRQTAQTYSSLVCAQLGSMADSPPAFWLSQLEFLLEFVVTDQDQDVVGEAVVLVEMVARESGLGAQAEVLAGKLASLGSRGDYSPLTPGDLKYFQVLERAHLYSGAAPASVGGRGGKDKKGKLSALALGRAGGRSPLSVRLDVARCLAVVSAQLNSEASQRVLQGLLAQPRSPAQLLAALLAQSQAGGGVSPGPECKESILRMLPRAELMPLPAVAHRYEDLAAQIDAWLERARAAGCLGEAAAGQVPLRGLQAAVSGASGQGGGGHGPALAASLVALQAEVQAADVQVRSAAASVCVALAELPAKLNDVIQPLMDAIRAEGEPRFRSFCASALAGLILQCRSRVPSPNAKLVKNVCSRVTLHAATAATGDCFAPPDATQSGALAVLEQLAASLGADLISQMPALVTHMSSHLGSENPVRDRALVLKNLCLVGHLSGSMRAFYPSAKSMLPPIASLVECADDGISTAASQCLVLVSKVDLEDILSLVFRQLVGPHLDPSRASDKTTSTLRLVGMLASEHQMRVAHVVPFLVLDVLKLMSSNLEGARKAAAELLGSLFPLFATQGGQGDVPPGYVTNFDDAKRKDLVALRALFDTSTVEAFESPVRLRYALRDYQQEGVNWLHFLRRFGINGILADDMGLGKTLQTLVLLASTLAEQGGMALVVAPSTLVLHWTHEIEHHLPPGLVVPLCYVGTVRAREAIRNQLAPQGGCNCLVTSYEVLRKDADWVSQHAFQYCVMDEGHLVKNPNSALFGACKRIQASHRLILTGTPIQNSVMELWALFDWLMPGFLGAQRDFQAKYGKALSAGAKLTGSKKERDDGVLVAEQLHREVSPFVLRRTKAMVLKDLPEKIIQDVWVHMSAWQARMYNELAVKIEGAIRSFEPGAKDGPGDAEGSFAKEFFLLGNVLAHPGLAVPKIDPGIASRLGPSANAEGDEWALEHSCKLVALKQVLEQCGIVGGEGDAGDDAGSGFAEASRQVLVFAQRTATLDVVERCLLGPLGVPCLRIDATRAVHERQQAALRFQSDATIPVLLLTTRIGGLGLNLTAADTVVFLEHDWNPMADIQAMDRAHRLGQKRTVNVLRVVTKGTFEEKLMSLQQFKVRVAETVVSEENAKADTLGAGQFVDLLAGQAGRTEGEGNGEGERSAKRLKGRSFADQMSAKLEEMYAEEEGWEGI